MVTDQNFIDFEPGIHGTTRSENVLVLSSSHTVFPLFSRGCLVPAIFEQNSAELPTGAMAAWLPTAVGALPLAWVTEVENTARNVIPIALELKRGLPLRHLDVEGCKIPVVSSSDVSSVLFRNEEELGRFTSWSYDDVDVYALGVPFESRPEAFVAQTAPDDPRERLDNEHIQRIRTRVRSADMLIGLLAATVYISGASRGDIETLRRLLELDVAGDHPMNLDPTLYVADVLFPGSDSRGADTVDGRLLIEALSILAHQPPQTGWPAKEILEELRSRSMDHFNPDSSEAKAIERWAEHCSKVLSSTAYPPLSDDGSLVRRALLLLLMREDPRSLADDTSIAQTIPIGRRVRRLAFQLAGARYGLRALPTDIKFAMVATPSVLLAAASSWFTSLLADLGRQELPKVHISYDLGSGYEGDWTVSLDAQPLWSKAIRVPAGLRKVAEDCRYYGFDVEVLTPYSFAVRGRGEKELVLDVEVSMLSYRPNEDKVRFASRVPSTTKDRRRGAKKASSLKKSDLLDLLKRNSYEDSHGRIAVDAESAEIIVIVDQLIDTMDRDECVSHLRNVSSLAAQLT